MNYSTECYHGRYLWQHYPRSLNGIVLVLVTIHDRKWLILFCFEPFISMNRLERKFQWFWFLPIIWNIRTHSVYKYCLLWIFNCALLIRVFILISSSEISLLQPWLKKNRLQFIKTVYITYMSWFKLVNMPIMFYIVCNFSFWTVSQILSLLQTLLLSAHRSQSLIQTVSVNLLICINKHQIADLLTQRVHYTQ